MQNLIKNRALLASDSWRLIRSADEDFSAQEDVILPLAAYLAHKAAGHAGQLAVWLAPEQDAAELQPHLTDLPLIAIDFPAFTDGRGYSHARLLRERYAYQGELRAIGDVLRDQLSYMAQVGFDAFAIRADRDAADALASLDDFSEQYQATVLHPVPLLKRRVGSVVV
jgi:uncharacterized protein (DUF934 family)